MGNVELKEIDYGIITDSFGRNYKVDKDWEEMFKWVPWSVSAKTTRKGRKGSSGYAVSNWSYMHRLIMDPIPSGMVVDHISGDTSDNRRSNLRIVSQSINCINSSRKRGSSQYVGVSWNKEKNKWEAYVNRRGFGKNGRVKVGYFDKEEDAALARDVLAAKIQGHDARLNFPDLTRKSTPKEWNARLNQIDGESSGN